MGPLAFERNEEVRVELEATVGQRIHLDNPTADALRVKLRVPGAVERIAEIDALAIAADFEHLRPTVRPIRRDTIYRLRQGAMLICAMKSRRI